MALKISRILHAGYLFETEKAKIVFDPIFENPFSRNCFAFPPVKFDLEKIRNIKLQAIFISHFHDDHCSFESLALLDRETPIYLFCVFEEMFDLLKQLGFKSVHSLKLGEPVQIQDVQITTHEALDAEVDSLFQIESQGLKILNVVDSWIGPETFRLLQKTEWDLILWPFQTMREVEVLSPSHSAPSTGGLPSEWLNQLKKLNPRAIVPSSCQFLQEPWSWYNHALFPVTYQSFEAQINQILPATKVIRMNPGVSIDAKTLGAGRRLDWVIPTGDQEVDYQYDPGRKPPSTAEVAKHFPELSELQLIRVKNFCGQEIFEKYDPSDEPFFRTPKNWCLSIYDHQGAKVDFHYRLGRDQLMPAQPGPPDWTTEIPAFKLYSALEAGESLTSMYLRINEVSFSGEIEAQLALVDPLEDPLIRALYSGIFGEYQKAQLRKLNET